VRGLNLTINGGIVKGRGVRSFRVGDRKEPRGRWCLCYIRDSKWEVMVAPFLPIVGKKRFKNF